jgi:hypothetical protein
MSLFIVIALAAIGYAQQSEIDLAKNTQIAGYPITNTGKAFEDFFMKPKWGVITDNSGAKIVVFKGIFDQDTIGKYMKSDAYKTLTEDQCAAIRKSLYEIAYDYGMRDSDMSGSDKNKIRQILEYYKYYAYKRDSSIEVHFRPLGDGKAYWVTEYKCDSCPPKEGKKDVNALYALVLDGRFLGYPEPTKTYAPASSASAPAAAPVSAVTAIAPAPAAVPLPAAAVPDKKIATTTRIGQYIAIDGEIAYFDIGKGEQAFIVSTKALPKVQTLKKGGMANVVFDTLERTINGNLTTIFIVTDIK